MSEHRGHSAARLPRIGLGVCAMAACAAASPQSLPATRAVSTAPLSYVGASWPAGAVPTPALAHRGPAWPGVPVTVPALVHAAPASTSAAVQAPALAYRGPVWPAAPVTTPPLASGGVAKPARQLTPLQPRTRALPPLLTIPGKEAMK